jgi:hypothetical protein
MQGAFDMNSSLNMFRAAVEEKIKEGIFDQYGVRHELLERNSYVYSDLRAKLMHKMKSTRHTATASGRIRFSLADLEQVAEVNGNNLKNVLNRAYVEVAKASS